MSRLVQHAALAFIVVAGSAVRVTQAARAAEQSNNPTPTIEQWLSLKAILKREARPSISPDGRSVAYTIRKANWEANFFDDQIWIADVSSGESYQLTDAKGSSSNVGWSPDGKHLAFLFTSGGGSQIYLASPPSKEVVRLTQVNNGVNAFQWSRDGRSIAFTTTEVFPRTSGDETPEYHIVENDQSFSSSLWTVAVSTDGKPTSAQPERLIDGVSLAVDDFSWSPDSRRIAFSANEYKAPYSYSTYDIYVLNLDDKSIKKIVDRKGPDYSPIWSPDGKEIAHMTYTLTDKDEFYIYSAGYIAVSPVEGGPSRVLTERFDENASPLAWSPDGIYFSALQKTYQHLFRLDPKTKAIQRVSQPYPSVFTAFSFTRDFKQAAFLDQDAKNYDELYVATLNSFKPKRLTSMGDQLKGWKIGTREVIEWKSKDRTPIEGVLIKPADFDPSRKYPLLVIIHTGPGSDVDQAIITRDMPYPAELFVAKGAVVLRPNYRGSPGYGRKFRALLARNEGIPQYGDIITGVDHLIAQGIVDPNRVGAMGYSAGGYISAFIATYSDRFKAIPVGAGISDMRLFYTLGAGGVAKPEASFSKTTPWDDPEYYRITSPLTYIKKAKTPTLIQHKESDRVAPPASAHEFYRALKDQGVPVKMIIYKGGGHQCSELKQCRDLVTHNYDWFRHWLWNE
jgi:dipeptidyl aminopeptidase/acylaminoacyl peptidase